MKRFFRLLPLFLASLLLSPPLAAQSPYSAAVTINGEGVTYFEIEQRALLLEALGTLGNVRKQARKDLIEDRLKVQAGRALGANVNAEEIKSGVEEFVKRVNMKPADFDNYLAQSGVEPETFVDFIKASLVWRKVVGGRFQSKAFISEAELETAMSQGTINLGASVLLSEIILVYTPETRDETLELAREVRSGIRSFADFEDAALTFSASQTRANGGKLDWTPLTALPEEVSKLLLTMGIGQVTQPLPLPGAVAMFQLRGVRDNRAAATKTIAYDYATLLLPGGRSAETLATAAKIRTEVDTCNDLLAVSTRYPEEYFSQTVTAVRQVPARISRELAHLDDNEISTTLTSGDNDEFLMMVMLCGRTNSISEGNREEVRLALFNQRMEAFGEGYLQELRGDAIIREK